MIAFKLLKRILIHKYYVAKYCFQIGLYWQGITHDLSKFSWYEFSRACKYWDDKRSSLANEKEILGWSPTFLHHAHHNPHHYEYWIYNHGDTCIPVEIPQKYLLELICDYLGACRAYGGDITDEYKYLIDHEPEYMHFSSKAKLYSVMGLIADGRSLKEAVRITFN